MNGLVTDLQMFALKTLQIPLPGRHTPSPCLSNGSETPGYYIFFNADAIFIITREIYLNSLNFSVKMVTIHISVLAPACVKLHSVLL